MSAPEPNTSAPIIIDALTLAREGAERKYVFRQRQFPRLTGLIVSDQPALDVSLQFNLGRAAPVIRGQLQGAVELICQRCMKSMQYLLNEQFSLLIVEADAVSSGDPDEMQVAHAVTEMEEWTGDATRIDVGELVEEQVIIALPLVAKHDDEETCAALLNGTGTVVRSDPAETGRTVIQETEAGGIMRRPFANLRELLNK